MSALPQPLSTREREFPFTVSDFRFLAALVYDRTGIHLAEHKSDLVYSRLVRRLRALRLGSFDAYCALLQGPDGSAELGECINAVTTNLTSFFREKHHFTHLETQVLKPLMKQPPHERRLRIWSAGCSMGMEPYSIAMVLERALMGSAGWDARILATDIDTAVLATGREGIYPREQYDRIPAIYHDLVTLGKDTISMSPALRERIVFNRLNLVEHWPMRGPFDAIFCRNVSIYFDKDTSRRLFDRMANLLKPGGWLYIGHSESLMDISSRFQNCGKTIYRKLK